VFFVENNYKFCHEKFAGNITANVIAKYFV